MDSFWQQICEVRLMPLTTRYGPDRKKLQNNDKYYTSENMITLSSYINHLKQTNQALFRKEINDIIGLRLS
jgi:hypothetical protein